MKPNRSLKIDAPAVPKPESEPDVWWGEEGIDARIWADPRPYEQNPASEVVQ
jgi:hypothetical protein